MEQLKKMLQQFLADCSSILGQDRIGYTQRKELINKLAPIVEKMKSEAESYAKTCENRIKENDTRQAEYMIRRANLSDEFQAGKNQVSALEKERIGILDAINMTRQEISENQSKIEELQKKIEKSKKDREYWNKVWWATCWIPFANIGTGAKKIVEDDEYSRQAQKIQKQMGEQRARIDQLNRTLAEIEKKQKDNKESSSNLANKITALEGLISSVTDEINKLKTEMTLCRKILQACGEISVEVSYANGKVQVIVDNLDRLNIINKELFGAVDGGTDNYVKGCICKGNTLKPGQKLNQNEYLLSENRRFAAVMQEDNNFVVYNSDRPLWASGTYKPGGGGYIEMDSSGIVSFKGADRIWNTKREGAAELIMQNDGNLVAYKKDHTPVWASDTYTYAGIPSKCFKRITAS